MTEDQAKYKITILRNGEYIEKMCDGKVYMGIRWPDYRYFPFPRKRLGRPPAPWCPLPYSGVKL